MKSQRQQKLKFFNSLRAGWLGRVAGAVSIYGVLIGVQSIPTYASMNGLTDASLLNPTSIQAQPPSCSDICPLLIGGSTSTGTGQGISEGAGSCNGHKISDASSVSAADFQSCSAGLNGGTWNPSTDDVECATRGFPTSVSAVPTSIPTPTASATTCNVPMLAKDGAGTKGCDNANKAALKCMLHGSQLEAQCLAWTVASQGNDLDGIMLALDLSVVTVCTAACFAGAATGVGYGAEVACKVGSIGAGITEIAVNLSQNTSPAGQAIGSLLGGIGGVASLGSGVKDLGGGALGIGGGDTFKDPNACISAATFAVMAGIRIYDLTQIESTKSNACNSVQSLWSTATGGAGGGGGTSQNPGQYLFNPQTGQFTSGGASGSGGGTGTGLNSSTNTPLNIPNTLAAAGNGSNVAATDSGMLTNSGMGSSLAPLAQKMLDNGLLSQAKQGAGAAVAGALGGAGGDFGSALSQVAQKSQDYAPDLLKSLGGGSGGYAGGGGGSKSSDSAAANPFASLFGGAAANSGGARTIASEQFGKESKIDIWHTGTTQNIFEIVSGKVSQVVSRVAGK